jgi:S1-C subfamily serine protease
LSFVSNELILEINDVELNRIPFQPKEDMEYGLYFTGKGLSIIRTLGEIIYFDEETSKGYMNFALAEKEGKSLSSEESEFTGNGSGFLITNDGYIATNYHVIEDVSEINVVFDVDGEQLSYSGEVVHSDKDNDVAIIKVDLSDRKVQLPYMLATKLQEVGSSIFALGYPYADVMGSEIKYTNGSVNARTGIQGDVRFYQVSAQVQPGNSGGPCFNEKGEIIGIVSAMLDDAVYENQNVNYVLKISYLKNLMELLPSKSTEFTPKVSKYGSTQDMIKDYKNFVPIIYTK